MFSSKKNSVLSSKLGHLVSRSKTVVAAAVAATTLGLASESFGAFSDVTSISTQLTVGSSTSYVSAGAGTTYSPFQATSANSPYTVHYAGDDDKVTSLVAGSKTYNAGPLASAVVRRYAGTSENNDALWYVGSYSGSQINLAGPQLSSFGAAFGSNNLLVGADNLFSNTGNAVGNNTNVSRLDVEFTPFSAASSKAFTIMDRGPTTDHDAFKIAAITSVSAGGIPTGYGPLQSITDGSWGKTNIVSTEQEIILRKNDNVVGDTFHPSDSTGQPIGGVLIQTTQLGIASGTTIYGYSLFSAAVPTGDSSAQLVAYASLPTANSTSTGGGLDPVATAGVLFTSAVPEPTTISIVAVGTLGLLGRRPKKIKKA